MERRSRNILAWLGQREEKETLDEALQHVDRSLACVRELRKALEAFVSGDPARKMEAIADIKKAEHEGDEIRRKMMEKLSQDVLVPPDREDLMFLNEALNSIADNAKGVGRLLEFLDQPPGEALTRLLLDVSLVAVQAGEKLENAISSLMESNTRKVLEDCAQIEILEEQGDDLKRELLRALVSSDMAPAVMLLVYEVIGTTEDVIDSIDRAGDLVRILAVKSH